MTSQRPRNCAPGDPRRSGGAAQAPYGSWSSADAASAGGSLRLAAPLPFADSVTVPHAEHCERRGDVSLQRLVQEMLVHDVPTLEELGVDGHTDCSQLPGVIYWSVPLGRCHPPRGWGPGKDPRVPSNPALVEDSAYFWSVLVPRRQMSPWRLPSISVPNHGDLMKAIPALRRHLRPLIAVVCMRPHGI
eukprot:gene23245-biopygen1243